MNKMLFVGVLLTGLSIGCSEEPAADPAPVAKAAPAKPKGKPTGPMAAPSAPPPSAVGGAVSTADIGGSPSDAADDAGSGDCDGLAEYADFVEEYIDFIDDGDMSGAMSLMSKAESAGEALASLDPGTDCYREYIAIQKTMTDAAMRMSGASAADMEDMDEAYEAMDEAMEGLGCMEACGDDPTCMMGCM